MARAYATAKDYDNGRKYLERARLQLSKLKKLDLEDRKIYLNQLRETEKLLT